MKKIIFLSFFVMMFMVCFYPCYSQQEPQEAQRQSVTGTVVSTDFAGSKIVLSTFQGDILFYVPENTVITRAEDTISLADIDISDGLTIEYYEDSSGNLKTIRIIDSNMGNAF